MKAEYFKALLSSFKKDVGLIRFQMESFEDFVENRIQKIIDEIGSIQPEVPEIGDLEIKLGKVRIGEPYIREADGSIRKILPREARIRDITYAAPIFVEATTIVNGNELDTVEVHIGDLPIMVKSNIVRFRK